MSKCLNREILQSLLDRELSAAAAKAAVLHLDSCESCTRALENIRVANLEIATLLDSLLPEQMAEVMPGTIVEFAPTVSTNHRRSAAVSVVAIAACALFAFIILRRDTQHQIPISDMAPRSIAALQPALRAAAIAPSSAKVSKPSVAPLLIPAKRAAHKPQTRPPDSATLDFIALDDGGPIESGMIVRMDLNASPANSHATHFATKIPVDVLVDEQGEVRAIRFLNGGAK